MTVGWECPKCAAIMSPHQSSCLYCKPKSILNDVKQLSSSCLHDWDYSQMFATNPPMFRCKKCGTYSVSINEDKPMLTTTIPSQWCTVT